MAEPQRSRGLEARRIGDLAEPVDATTRSKSVDSAPSEGRAATANLKDGSEGRLLGEGRRVLIRQGQQVLSGRRDPSTSEPAA